MHNYGYGDPFSMLVGVGDVVMPSPTLGPVMRPIPAGFNGGPLAPLPPGIPGVPGVPALPPFVPFAPYGGPSCFPYDYYPPQSPFYYREAANTAIAAKTTQEPLGLTSDNGDDPIDPGDTRTVQTSPQNVVCITDFDCPRSIAVFFIISSIKTGLVEHMLNGPISADTIAVDSIHPPIKATTLWPGMRLSMTVKNVHPEDALHFYCTAWAIAGPNCGPCI